MEKPIVNLGEQRFDRLIEQNKFYIDKTEFIREWWESGATVTLITRPRRFGKTLNMSMIECFFSNKYAGRGDLFEELSIWNKQASSKDKPSGKTQFPDNPKSSDSTKLPDEKHKYRELQGTFPVIFFSFAGMEASNYHDMIYQITEVIARLYEQHRYLLEGNVLSQNERNYYNKIQPGMEKELATGAVHSMACFMQRYYAKDVIILLDEYDAPMQAAWLHGYWDEAVSFFNGLFNNTFKTNPYLYRSLITGITRVAKESIFSGLNNPEVITTTSNKYTTSFGFTETEVFQALDSTGLGEEKQRIKKWYDGFTFGSCTDIYNPWSIASFINSDGKYETYWANTSSNGLVNSLIQEGNAGLKQTMENLIQCSCTIKKQTTENKR